MLCNCFQCYFAKEIKKIFDFLNSIGGRVVNRCYILSDALWQKGKSLWYDEPYSQITYRDFLVLTIQFSFPGILGITTHLLANQIKSMKLQPFCALKSQKRAHIFELVQLVTTLIYKQFFSFFQLLYSPLVTTCHSRLSLRTILF